MGRGKHQGEEATGVPGLLAVCGQIHMEVAGLVEGGALEEAPRRGVASLVYVEFHHWQPCAFHKPVLGQDSGFILCFFQHLASA